MAGLGHLLKGQGSNIIMKKWRIFPKISKESQRGLFYWVCPKNVPNQIVSLQDLNQNNYFKSLLTTCLSIVLSPLLSSSKIYNVPKMYKACLGKYVTCTFCKKLLRLAWLQKKMMLSTRSFLVASHDAGLKSNLV